MRRDRDSFDWENTKPPKIPYHKSIIYETHVKGFTQLHPDILDTHKNGIHEFDQVYQAEAVLKVEGRSVILLHHPLD